MILSINDEIISSKGTIGMIVDIYIRYPDTKVPETWIKIYWYNGNISEDTVENIFKNCQINARKS